MVRYVLLQPLRPEVDGQDVKKTPRPSSSDLRGRRRTYLTILELADHALFKMVTYVLLCLLRPELVGQDVKAFSREGASATFR
jgi:hypothetical protein